jgi:N-acetylneuraminic acid mutarotase
MNTLNLHSKLQIGRVGHAAVYINNKDIYVIGGYNSNKNQWLASVETCYDAFNLDQKPEWTPMAEMNEPRYYFGCCTWNNEFIFVFGGMNDKFMEQ